MKTPLSLAVAVLIAGCASSGDIAGVKSSSETNGLMLTVRPADQVTQCLASVLGEAAQPEGAGFKITSGVDPVSIYHVRPFSDKLHRYSTIVEISGLAETTSGPLPATCLLLGGRGRIG